jgi:hypothetical protein
LSALQSRTPAAGIRNGARKLVGAYVASIQGRSVFSVEQANLALTAIFDASTGNDPIEFVFIPESRSDAVDFRRQPLRLQLSQLKRFHAPRTVSGEWDSASVSTTVAPLEDAYTDADLFATISQIRGDEPDGTCSLHLYHGEATLDEQAFGSVTGHELKQFPTSRDLCLASEWKQLDVHQQPVPLVVLPHLVPRCCVPIGITTLSRLGQSLHVLRWI